MTSALGYSAGIKPVLYIRESDEFNAAATYDKNGLPIIIINKPMFDLIKDEPDMAAALIGHEVAHLSLNHSNSRFVTNTLGTVLGVVAGVALESIIRNNYGVANVGIQGGNIVGIAFSSSFTREQEREADRIGILWAKENGYDPSGAVRLFKVLEKKSSNKTISFLRSHPNPTERIKNAEQAVK